MASADTVYQADFPVPELIEQGRDNVIECGVYLDAALVTPAGTVSVYDASDTAIVDGAAITVVADVATYTVTDAMTSSSSLGEGWRVVWSLTIDGTVRTFDNDAALVRRRLFPTVTHADLYKRAPALDPAGSAPISARSDYQEELDSSWNVIEHRLIAAGKRPWLVVSPSSLRLAHFELWMATIFEGFSHRLNDAHRETAEMHRARWDDEWSRIRLLYDSDDDGDADSSATRIGVTSTLWTC